MKTTQYASVLLLSLLMASPVWAASKSATARISCTILPMIEADLTPARVQANGNLGETQYRMQQEINDKNGLRAKHYSITAL